MSLSNSAFIAQFALQSPPLDISIATDLQALENIFGYLLSLLVKCGADIFVITASEEYINNCQFAPLETSQEEMELAMRAGYYRIEREEVDQVVAFLQKQEKIPHKIKKILSKLQDFIEDSEEMMTRFFQLQKKRIRENAEYVIFLL